MFEKKLLLTKKYTMSVSTLTTRRVLFGTLRSSQGSNSSYYDLTKEELIAKINHKYGVKYPTPYCEISSDGVKMQTDLRVLIFPVGEYMLRHMSQKELLVLKGYTIEAYKKSQIGRGYGDALADGTEELHLMIESKNFEEIQNRELLLKNLSKAAFRRRYYIAQNAIDRLPTYVSTIQKKFSINLFEKYPIFEKLLIQKSEIIRQKQVLPVIDQIFAD